MTSREYTWFAGVLAVGFVLLVCFAGVYEAGRGSGERKANRAWEAKYERTNERWKRLVDAYANQGTPPGQQLEWTASKPLTFTIAGKPLRCVGLLNKLGDVRSISCNWDQWRNG